MNYIILLLSSVFAALGQLFFKLGSTVSPLSMIFSVKIWIGLILYGAGTLLWIYVLSKEPLSKVYPFTALTFILVFFLSYFILNEAISLVQIIGVIIILVGFMVLALAS